jgi:glycosyltransferase involved in cell wall biosynthesis
VSVGEGRRIALLLPSFWPEVRRGGERIVHELAGGLIAAGERPRLITSHPGPTRRTVEEGLPITRHRRPPDRWLVRRAFEDHLTHVPFAYRDLARGDDDIAHAFFATDALAAGRWSRRTGRPAVFSYLGSPTPEWLDMRRGRAGILRRAAAGSAAVTVLSRTAAEAMRRVLGIEARVIHPGVDLSVFTADPRQRASEPTIFCAAPVDVGWKRVDLLIAAFALVRRERSAAQLVLLRPDDPQVASRTLAAGPGIELVDPVSDPRRLAGTYRRAWVTALPSRGDSFGLVLAESLACGTPVVGSVHGALPEVVDRQEIGQVFEPDDASGLARALLEVLETAGRPDTVEACRARAGDFSIEANVRAHLELYDAVAR